MQASLQGKDNTADSQITKLTEQVTNLQAQNNLFRAENDKIKQHYKELYDSIKITRAKHIEQVTALTTKNVNLKAQTLEKVNSVSKDQVKPKVLARGKHAIDVEPIVPRLRNNRDAHLDYLRHLKESVEIIRDIVEEARVVRPLDRSIVSACCYTKHSHKLLEYAIGTYPQGSQQRAKQLAYIPLIRKKQVTIAKPYDEPYRVNSYLNASGSQPKSHTKINRISPAKGVNKLPLLELMLSKRSKKNTKCVNAVNEELTAAKHKLMVKDPLSKGPPQVVSEPFGELLLKKNFVSARIHFLFSIFIDSLSPQVVSAAKLPILNPNEFDL
nr:hypothetical protein [Tanacetum cinerariifolium]